MSARPPTVERPDLADNETAVVATLVYECPVELPLNLGRLLAHTPDSFDDPRCGRIAFAVRQLRTSGTPVHTITVREQLARNKQLDGADRLLLVLSNSVLPIDLADYEAGQLWEQFRTRRIRSLLAEGAEAIEARPDHAADISRRVRTSLDALDAEAHADLCAQPIGTLTAPQLDNPDELVKLRYLCRGAGLLLVGQSGKGKSSLAVQMAVLWSLGRDCFGIHPSRPLRVLLIQAENDDHDLWEMFTGIVTGLNLSESDRKQAGEQILFHCEDARAGDDFLRRTVEPLVKKYRPDLLILDPALAYVGGDTKDAEAVGNFLRRRLNPILHAYGCAALVVHHTTKQKADGQQTTSDFLYAGAGSIEFTNWARAVLALETLGNGCYRLHAPKRGGRIGWADADGRPMFDAFIRHTRTPGAIFWQAVDADEIGTATRTGKSKLDLLALVPAVGTIPQTVLLQKAGTSGIGQKKARAFLDELLDDHTLHLWRIRRKGTNPEKRVSRQPQPEGALQAA